MRRSRTIQPEARRTRKKDHFVARLKLIIAFLILVFPELGWTQTAKEKIRVALGSITVNSSVIPIGKEAGIFAKYGMEIEAIHMGGGVNSVIVYRGRGPIEPRFCKNRLDKSCSLGYCRVDESGQGIQGQSY